MLTQFEGDQRNAPGEIANYFQQNQLQGVDKDLAPRMEKVGKLLHPDLSDPSRFETSIDTYISKKCAFENNEHLYESPNVRFIKKK